jgi:hypothetical protein
VINEQKLIEHLNAVRESIESLAEIHKHNKEAHENHHQRFESHWKMIRIVADAVSDADRRAAIGMFWAASGTLLYLKCLGQIQLTWLGVFIPLICGFAITFIGVAIRRYRAGKESK